LDSTADDVSLEAAVEEGGISVVMPIKNAPYDVVVSKGGVRIPIYHNVIRYESGELVDNYRVLVKGGAKPEMRGFVRDPALARKFAQELGDERDRENAEPKMPDEAAGLIKLIQFFNDAMTKVGRNIHVVVDDIIRAAKGQKEFYGDNSPPTYTQLSEAGIAADKLKASFKRLTSDQVLPIFLATDKTRHEKGRKAQSVKKRNESYARRFCLSHGTRVMADVTTAEVNVFLCEVTKGCARKTADGAIGAIRNFFRSGRNEAGALPDGDTAADRARINEDDFESTKNAAKEKKISYYTAAEAGGMLLAALLNREWRKYVPVLVLWLFAGIHFAEQLRMRWKHIKGVLNKHGQAIVTEYAKGNHTERKLFLSAAAFSWLAAFLRLARIKQWLEYPIVPSVTPGDLHPDREYDHHWEEFNKVLKQILAQTGIAKKDNGSRHSFATPPISSDLEPRLRGSTDGEQRVDDV
jgi:site-specific recombinase XerD